MPRLENWTIIKSRSGKERLFGQVYGDNRFEDGHRVITSEIVILSEESNRATTRSGTEYVLGEKYIFVEYPNIDKLD